MEEDKKVLNEKLKSIKELLKGFEKRTGISLERIDKHLIKLNTKVVKHEVALKDKVEESEFNKLCKQVDKNAINKPIWFAFTAITSTAVGLAVYIIQHF